MKRSISDLHATEALLEQFFAPHTARREGDLFVAVARMRREGNEIMPGSGGQHGELINLSRLAREILND